MQSHYHPTQHTHTPQQNLPHHSAHIHPHHQIGPNLHGGPFAYTHQQQQQQQQAQHNTPGVPGPQGQGGVGNHDDDDDDDEDGDGGDDNDGSPTTGGTGQGTNASGSNKAGGKARGGGRPKDQAWEFFDGDRDRASCKSCGWTCDRPKAFRMREHILRDCQSVPESERERLKAHQASKEANAAINKENKGKKRKRDYVVEQAPGPSQTFSHTFPKAIAKRQISCHVLDSTSGKPGADMEIRLDRLTASGFVLIGSSQTNTDGRCTSLIPPTVGLEIGIYKMTFFTSKYFSARGILSFYPFVEVTFEVKEAESSYHIPLLLSPYSYTTYRGS